MPLDALMTMMKKTYSQLEKDYDRSVEQAAKRLKTSKLTFDIDFYFEKALKRTNRQARTLIPVHTILLRLACTTMLFLARDVGHSLGGTQRQAFAALQHRATNYLVSIRQLLLAGFEDSCRPLSRSYLETLDLALVCLVDASLAERYFGDESEFKSFWKDHLAYGKIYTHVRHALELAGLSKDIIDDKIAIRKNQKDLLSASLHGDDAGAFRSMFPPPLGYPDMVSLEPHGVVSFHTANHAAGLITETFQYCVTILKLVMSGRVEALAVKDKDRHAKFAAQFFAFQDMYHAHDLVDGEKIIAPDYRAKRRKGAHKGRKIGKRLRGHSARAISK